MEHQPRSPNFVLEINCCACDSHARKLKRWVEKIDGVSSVEIDPENRLHVWGKIDPKQLLDKINSNSKFKNRGVTLNVVHSNKNNSAHENTRANIHHDGPRPAAAPTFPPRGGHMPRPPYPMRMPPPGPPHSTYGQRPPAYDHTMGMMPPRPQQLPYAYNSRAGSLPLIDDVGEFVSDESTSGCSIM